MLSLDEFEPWLKNSGLPLFPEYTEHGPEHIEDVILTASGLIRDEAWKVITPSDAAMLILATLLHDSAMHLSEDGFVQLVRLDSERSIIDGFGDKLWPLLWEDFLAEATRFDGRKLMALFGDTEPVHRPQLDPLKMTKRDRLLIGEFLRRHHHRLAHEIALVGVPGPTEKPLRLKEVPEDLTDLAGLVARSHGLPVRSCLDYLRSNYKDSREYKGVHAVFLMALLRVSDYLQVQSERAPKEMLKVRSLRSPTSQEEWKAHHAIRDIRHTHEDQEAIFIDAVPPDVQTYLKVKEWLVGIQSEMDASWAVLGEVYSRYGELNQLGLTLRRVRSNLDDEVTFAKTVNYVPCRAAFEAASPDLLKLMINPLYGDHPEFGIRELIQNAVDAVRELQEYRKQRPDLDVELTSQDADVVVSLDKESDGISWVTVSDRGIGMTSEVVREYFLKAGASFRKSDAWRKWFEDEEGKSRVLRSGRFGVGMLTAFLLGKEIQMSTRHVDVPRDEGIAFTATIDTEEIELKRVPRSVGTTVRVRISDEVRNRLSEHRNEGAWDWYCLTDPKVLCLLNGGGKKLAQRYHLPSPGSDLPPQWRRIHHPHYQEIHWSYSISPELACNGIIVIDKPSVIDYGFKQDGLWGPEHTDIPVTPPNVSVFDPDGNLPLTLQRTRLTTRAYPLGSELLADVIRDFIAFALVHAPSQPLTDVSSTKWYWNSGGYPGLYRGSEIPRGSTAQWFSTKKGVSLYDDWFIREVDMQRALVIPQYRRNTIFKLGAISQLVDAIFAFSVHTLDFGTSDYLVSLLVGAETGRYNFTRNIRGSRILIARRLSDKLIRPRKLARELQTNIEQESKTAKWVVWKVGECSSPALDFQQLAEDLPEDEYHRDVIAEWHFADEKPIVKRKLSLIARMWREIVGSPVIPFDQAERRRKLASAYETLKPYIEAHEALAKIQSSAGRDAE